MKLTSLFLLFVASGAFAGEIPVKNGLVLRLDAGEQATARTNAHVPPLGNLMPVDRWLDTSGNARHALQTVASHRPVFKTADGEALLRFDGAEDFLAISGPHLAFSNITVFVLAAPRTNTGAFSALFSTVEAGQNDYTSGLNLDFGPYPTRELSVLNLESAGSPGFHNFLEPGKNLAAELRLGGFHVFTVRS